VAYLKDIIQGIEALRMHRMNYEISLEGNNELTQLAASINYLSKTERELREKEMKMQEDKEQLVRALSHDIRTPLTSILSYSEYLKDQEELGKKEIEDYILLVQQKAEQIKILTNQLLDEGRRQLEEVENGKFLMQQLVDEWEASMEGVCECNTYLEKCPEFSCAVDIQELRRIFDNLASNIVKYADTEKEVLLSVLQKENRLVIEQSNICRQNTAQTESHKIGIKSIQRIAASYGGYVDVMQGENMFKIEIGLMELI
jgi:signal transduction histidine kinase